MKKSQRIAWVILFFCLWISRTGYVTETSSLMGESLSPRKSIPTRHFSFRFKTFNALKGGIWTQLSQTEEGIRYRVKLPNQQVVHILAKYPYSSKLARDERAFIDHLLKDPSSNKRYLSDDLGDEAQAKLGTAPAEGVPSLDEGYVEILRRSEFLREDVIAVFFTGSAVQVSQLDEKSEQDGQNVREIAIEFTVSKLQVSENEVRKSVTAFFQKEIDENIHQLVEIRIASINAANRLLADKIKKTLSSHNGPLWLQIGKFHLPALVAKGNSIVLEESFEALDEMVDPRLQQAAFYHARTIWVFPKGRQPRQEEREPRRVRYWNLDKIDFKKIRYNKGVTLDASL